MFYTTQKRTENNSKNLSENDQNLSGAFGG
jgi:hypothetical protein